VPEQDQPAGELALEVTRPEDSVVVLEVGGDLDLLTAPSLDAELTKLLADAPDALVLNLTGVPFFGSSALAVLIRAADTAQTRGVRLMLVATNRAVLRPLEVTKTVELFSIHGSVDSALSTL
jgi:anti-sigma B factor antagonist